MKISYWLPENRDMQNALSFINLEIDKAQNIKSRHTRKKIVGALHSIYISVARLGSGHCYYADENEHHVEEYNGNQPKYHIGKQYIKPYGD